MTWPLKKLKYLCTDPGQYGLNVSADSYVASGIRLIRTSDISDSGVLRQGDAVYVRTPPEGRHLLQRGDLLFSRSGTLGRVLRIQELPELATFAGYLVRFRPNSSNDSRFLEYAANSASFQGAIKADAIASTIQNFNAEKYANVRLPAPPLDEQRRIADFLDAETARMDEISSLKVRMLSVVNDRLAAWRDRIFTDSAEVRWVPLMHLTQQSRPIVYGIVQAGPDIPDGVPYIKTGDLPNIDPQKLSKTSRDIHAQYRRAAVRPGDIVMAMRASIGTVAVVPPDLAVANLTQGTARIAPAQGIDTRWLYHALQVRHVQEQCQTRSVGTTFRTLNIWDLRRIAVPLTPEPVRQSQVTKFDHIYDRHLEHVRILNRQLSLISERRQALITAAVTGHFDVTTARSEVRV